MTIPDEAVQAMPERIYAVKQTEGSNCVVSFDTPSLDYNIEYVRADLALPFLQGVKPEAIQLIERMAFGYEVMFEKLCHISGTSGESQSWYIAKAREATDRISPLHSITVDSNEVMPGDCKKQYRDFMASILSAIEPAPSPRAQALEEDGLLNSAALIIEGRSTAVNSDFIESLANRKAWEVAEIIADHDIRLGAAIRALSSQPVADGVDSIEVAHQEDDLTDCFRHHVKTSIGWQAFGARTGKERQMYEEGFKAGYRRCKSDNEPELGEDELQQDVINLVIAAREACDSWQLAECEFKQLDKALDAFSERVPYENEPDDLPASPGASE